MVVSQWKRKFSLNEFGTGREEKPRGKDWHREDQLARTLVRHRQLPEHVNISMNDSLVIVHSWSSPIKRCTPDDHRVASRLRPTLRAILSREVVFSSLGAEIQSRKVCSNPKVENIDCRVRRSARTAKNPCIINEH